MAYRRLEAKSPLPFEVRTAQLFFNGSAIAERPQDARSELMKYHLNRFLVLNADALTYNGHGILFANTAPNRIEADQQVGKHAEYIPQLVKRTIETTPVYIPKSGKPLSFSTMDDYEKHFPIDLVVIIDYIGDGAKNFVNNHPS